MRVTGSGVASSAIFTVDAAAACSPWLSAAGETMRRRGAGRGKQVGKLELRAVGRAHGLFGGGELDGLRHDVGPVQMLAELLGGDVIGGFVRPRLICQPTILSAPGEPV